MKKLSGILLGVALLGATIGAVGAFWGADVQRVEARRDTISTCWVSDVVTGDERKAYSNDDWVVTYGGANQCIVSSADNIQNVSLSAQGYSKYADGTNINASDGGVAAVANL